MVNALTFDTHQFVKDLTAVGFTDAQAETVTSLVRQAREVDLADLATKTDLKTELERLQGAIERLKVDVGQCSSKADLAETKADFLKWMVGAIAFQTAAVLGAVAVLARAIP